jgi:hypothetical protein
MIGGSDLVNLTPEESAAVRLVKNEFPFTVNAQLRRARDEAETIRRRIGDRFTEAGRAGGLVFKCRGGPDLKTVVTIPVTAELIWSWLRWGEVVNGGEHYVDVQIGPPELPEVTLESQHAVSPSGQTAGQPSAELSPVFTQPAEETGSATAAEEEVEAPDTGAKEEGEPAPKPEQPIKSDKHPGGRPKEWDWPELHGRWTREGRTFPNETAFWRAARKEVLRVDRKQNCARPKMETVKAGITELEAKEAEYNFKKFIVAGEK